MGKYTKLDKRMKRYEAASETFLTRRMPVVLRFDGKSFHTFTKGFEKPFDAILMKTMQETMLDLCKNIQGAVFGYTQSDEITIITIDYQTLETDAWLDYRVEKMCSIGGSMASRFFNKHYIENVEEAFKSSQISQEKYNVYAKKFFGADFDCRAFNVPKEDVCNCVLWRQQDAEKNSILTLAQSFYTQKEMNGKKTNELQNMMFTEKGVNWSELPIQQKRGTACKKYDGKNWMIDYEMPILTEKREYVEKTILL